MSAPSYALFMVNTKTNERRRYNRDTWPNMRLEVASRIADQANRITKLAGPPGDDWETQVHPDEYVSETVTWRSRFSKRR